MAQFAALRLSPLRALLLVAEQTLPSPPASLPLGAGRTGAGARLRNDPAPRSLRAARSAAWQSPARPHPRPRSRWERGAQKRALTRPRNAIHQRTFVPSCLGGAAHPRSPSPLLPRPLEEAGADAPAQCHPPANLCAFVPWWCSPRLPPERTCRECRGDPTGRPFSLARRIFRERIRAAIRAVA